MSAPYDQLHDESLERPNAPPRGMHGQSVKRSEPYDERFAQELKSQLDDKDNTPKDAAPPKSNSESVDTKPQKPVPRGMHGESVMRSKPYDERFAQEFQSQKEND